MLRVVQGVSATPVAQGFLDHGVPGCASAYRRFSRSLRDKLRDGFLGPPNGRHHYRSQRSSAPEPVASLRPRLLGVRTVVHLPEKLGRRLEEAAASRTGG